MPDQEGNEGHQGHNHEERPTGDSRGMPGLRHQDVQDRQGLAVISQVSEKAGYLPPGYPAFLLPESYAS